MTSRDKRIKAEAIALWREMCDGPPPEAKGAELLELMLSRLPKAGYERLNSPFLRAGRMTFPKTR
jgi:hypothetical protein